MTLLETIYGSLQAGTQIWEADDPRHRNGQRFGLEIG